MQKQLASGEASSAGCLQELDTEVRAPSPGALFVNMVELERSCGPCRMPSRWTKYWNIARKNHEADKHLQDQVRVLFCVLS